MFVEYKLFFPEKIEVAQEQKHPTSWIKPKINEKDFTKENYENCIECANSKIEMKADEIKDEWIRVTASDACKFTYADYKVRTPYAQNWGLGLTYYLLYANRDISQSASIDIKCRYGALDFAAGPILPMTNPKVYGANISVTCWLY
jgi:hypothetical protein